jgi:RNA polymerase sigma-70 factor (ECF subfamily)
MHTTKLTQLANKTREGDLVAFKQLFNSCYKKLCVYSNEIIYDFDVCKDIVQDVFVKFWEKRESLPFFDDFEPYIYKAVKNKSLDYLKKIFEEDKYIAYVIENVNLNFDQNSVHDYEELKNLIDQTLEQIPDPGKSIFKLNIFHNKKQKQIADVYKLSLKSVEWYVSNVRKELKKVIKNYQSH